MGRLGGQGKGKPKLKDRDFGKSLINQMKSSNKKTREKAKMNSILDNSALDDYIITAEMDSHETEVVKVHNQDAYLTEPTIRKFQYLETKQFDYKQLQIPRKPAWSRDMTAEDVDRKEKTAFLSWRRDIAMLENAEDSKRVTPYEKNIEVWRQLWRVLEKCDIALQIVDARNPLLYYTNDLGKYASEINPPRPVIVLINKSDFLTDYQRQQWADYFDSLHLMAIFYSAHKEQAIIDAMTSSSSSQLPKMKAAESDELDTKALAEEIFNIWQEQINVKADSRVLANKIISNKKEAGSIARNEVNNVKKDAVKIQNDDLYENLSDNDEGIGYDDSNVDEEDKDDEEDEEYDEDELDESGSEYDDDDDSEGGEDDEEDGDDSDAGAENFEKCNKDDVDNKNNPNDSEEGIKYIEGWPEPFELKASNEPMKSLLSEKKKSIVRVLSRLELIDLLQYLPLVFSMHPQSRHAGRFCIGMVGYPNVGKSSVINTIMGVSKSTHGTVRVGVSSTPGKTKHFQTLIVNDSLMLCDCPGLVFPSFMNSTGEMICAGILPINQMRDHIEPAAIIASRVPMHVLDAIYGMHIKKILDYKDVPDRPPTASEFLSAYCEVKGYITGGTGRWDEFRACKDILRDFNDGRILYACQPPTISDTERWLADSESMMARNERVAERLAMQRLKDIENDEKQSDVEILPSIQPSTLKNEVVFGNGIIYDDESDEDVSEASEMPISIDDRPGPKREHKRLKHWGKKGKKLRDKTPYSEENGTVSYVAYSTNRSLRPLDNRIDAKKSKSVPFVRQAFPFHSEA